MTLKMALAAVLMVGLLPLYGLVLPTGLGDFGRAQERQRAAAREARRVPLPEGDRRHPVVSHPDGSRGSFGWVGSARYTRAAGAAIALAHDRPEEIITGAFETRDGWVFVTEWGRALASETFLGPLRVIATVACEVASPAFGRGTAVQRVGGEFFSLDPRRGRVPLHPPAGTEEVLFCGRLGAAMTGEGDLHLTVDGGRRWSAALLRTPTNQPDVALSLRCAWPDEPARGLLVRTTTGWRSFDPDTAGDPPTTSRPWSEAPDDEADDEPIVRAVAAGRFEPLTTPMMACPTHDVVEPWLPDFVRYNDDRRPAGRAPLFPSPSTHASEVPAAAGAWRELMPDDPARCRVELRWRGRDARGPFVGAADVNCVLSETAWTIVNASLPWLAVNRDGALLTLPGNDPGQPSELVWVSGRRAVALAPFQQPWFSPFATRLDDGRVLIYGVEHRVPGGANAAVIATVNADGSFASRAWNTREPGSALVGPAEVGGRLGLVVADPARVARFLPMDGGDPVRLGVLPRARPLPCPAAVDGAPRLHLFFTEPTARSARGLPFVLGEGTESEDAELLEEEPHAVYELRGATLCVRTIDSFRRHESGDQVRPSARLEARGDHIEGTIDDGRTLTRVRLTLYEWGRDPGVTR